MLFPLDVPVFEGEGMVDDGEAVPVDVGVAPIKNSPVEEAISAR